MTFADFEPVSSNTQEVPSSTQDAPSLEKLDSPIIPITENQAVECKEDCEIDEPKTTKIVHVHYHYVINVNNKNCDAQNKQDSPSVSDILGISSEPMSLLTEGSVVAISTSLQPDHCLNNMEPSTGGSLVNGQWRVKETERGHFLFCSSKREKNGSLRVGKLGKVSCDGGTGPWAQFKVESLGGSQISIQSVGNEEVYGRKWYLAVDQATGGLVGNSTVPFPFYLVACEAVPLDSKPMVCPLKQGKRNMKLKQVSNQSAATTSERLAEASDARTAFQPGKVVVLCSFETQQNRKRTDGWHLGVSPTGMLVPDAGQSSWGQWRVELPERKKSTASTTEVVCFASVHTPKWHLRVNGDGRVSPKGGRGSLAQFKPIFHSNNGRVSFQCVAHGEEKPNRDGGNGWCLAVMEDGNIVGNADASQPYAQFLVREVPPTQIFNNAQARAQDQTIQQSDQVQGAAKSLGQDPSMSQHQRQQEGGLHIPLRFAGRCRFGPRRYRLGARCMGPSAATADTTHSTPQAGADNREKKTQPPLKSADRAAQVATVRMAAFKELLDKAMEKAASLTAQAKEDPNNNRLQLQAKKMEAKVQKLQQRLEFWNQRVEKCREASAKSDEPAVVSQDSCKDASISSTPAEETKAEVPSEAQQLDEVLDKIRVALTSTDTQTKQQLLNMLNSLLSGTPSEEQTKKE